MMHRTLLLLALALTLATALPGFAQDEADVDACVRDAAENAGWVLPWTLAEALELRTELDEIIQRCSDAETGEADEGGEEAAPAPSAAEDGIPRTMYVRTSARRVNLRSSPTTTAPVVATLAHGAPVEVLTSVRGGEFAGSKRWFLTHIDNNPAWIHSALLSETRPAPRAQAQQRVQEQPAPDAGDQGCLGYWLSSGGRTRVPGDDGHDTCWQYEAATTQCETWSSYESIERGAKSPGTGWFHGGLVNDGGRLCILWLLNPVEVVP